jgi:hypothetical protein
MSKTKAVLPGTRVRVRAAGTNDDWTGGVVVLASANGRSVGLLLDGMVRAKFGFIGRALPLTVDPAAGTVTGLDDQEYEMEVLVGAERNEAKA